MQSSELARSAISTISPQNHRAFSLEPDCIEMDHLAGSKLPNQEVNVGMLTEFCFRCFVNLLSESGEQDLFVVIMCDFGVQLFRSDNGGAMFLFRCVSGGFYEISQWRTSAVRAVQCYLRSWSCGARAHWKDSSRSIQRPGRLPLPIFVSDVQLMWKCNEFMSLLLVIHW